MENPNAKLIERYETKLQKVKAMHPTRKNGDYIAFAELELEAVQSGGMVGLKELWNANLV